MKTTLMYSLLAASLLSLSSQAATPGGNRADLDREQDSRSQLSQQITQHFTDHLSGQEAVFGKGQKIKSADLKTYRALVWEAWKKANLAANEEKLPAPSKLEQAQAYRWVLPDSLEPHAVMPFYWGSKGTETPQEGYPLFLYLHGSGPKESEWATGLKICQMFDDSPSLYFIPQIPNMGNYYRWWQKSKQFAWERLLRQALVSGRVNPNRVYVFGISEGGYGSQRLASFYADYWAAAGPMAGGEPLKNAPAENCSNIAFSLLTGDKDYGFYRNKLTSYVKAAFDSLQSLHPAGFTHRIELIPGRGHGIDYRPTTPWLKQYTRNPYPKHVSWENFEMDGWYRKGFYNLYVIERSNADEQSRTYYEMDITGNNISLTVDEVTYQATETDPRWGIQLKFAKKRTPARKGKIILYLCDELVDLDKKVTLTVNGKKVFKGKVKADIRHMVNSCAAFFDPMRIYPAAIEVDLEKAK